MSETLNLIATAAFGLEATVKREVAALGCHITSSQDGRIDFTGDINTIIDANLRLGAADRVLLKMGEFEARTFEELFEQTKALPWGDWITKDGNFTINGKSIKSQLHSVPACQSIVEKAIVEKLKIRYKGTERFMKTGAAYNVRVALLRDKATLTLDTSGDALFKRGYRNKNLLAPIKETLAFALVELSYWRKDRIFYDPFCGSGTLAIEAALMARNIPPGINRRFAGESWPALPKPLWAKRRAQLREQINIDFLPKIYASDISDNEIQTARACAKAAGVQDCIHFMQSDIKNAKLPGEYGVIITNPPYGERLLKNNETEELYKTLGNLMKNEDTWSVYVITPCEDFENLYGKKADSKRKLFNGNVKTDYYQYHGKRPPKVY